MSAIRPQFTTRDFPKHQGVAGAIEYITNSDRFDVFQHSVALNVETLVEASRFGFPSRYAVRHPTHIR